MVSAMSTFTGDALDYQEWIDKLPFPLKVNVRKSRGEEGFIPESVSTGVTQIYKDLIRDNLSVNGAVYRGDKIGVNGMISSFTHALKTAGDGVLSDVDCVVGARDVLLGCNRSRSGGDSYWVVNRCCVNNNENVVLCPSEGESKPITITVEKWYRREGIEGWVEVGRKRRRKVWAKAKEGRVVYWERRGGRKVGEIELKNAGIREQGDKGELDKGNAGKRFLVLNTPNKDLHIRLPTEALFTQWKLAITEEISLTSVFGYSFSSSLNSSSTTSSTHMPGTPPSQKKTINGEEGGGSGRKKKGFMNVLSRNRKDNSKSPGVATSLPNRSPSSVPSLSSPTGTSPEPPHPTPRVQIGVHIKVSVSNLYKVCTTDPEGDDDDVWAVVEGVFEQGYWLEKGEEIIRGEETVKINLID